MEQAKGDMIMLQSVLRSALRFPALATIVLAAGFGSAGFVPAGAAEEWRTYHNARFGLVVDVPADFQPGMEPANGDGLSFFSPDGHGAITAYGGFWGVTQPDFGAYRSALVTGDRESGLDVTYQETGEDWFVYSGILGGDIVYQRVEIATGCSGDIALHVRLVYPREAKEAWDPVVARAAGSLAAGAGLECD